MPMGGKLIVAVAVGSAVVMGFTSLPPALPRVFGHYRCIEVDSRRCRRHRRCG